MTYDVEVDVSTWVGMGGCGCGRGVAVKGGMGGCDCGRGVNVAVGGGWCEVRVLSLISAPLSQELETARSWYFWSCNTMICSPSHTLSGTSPC